MLLYSRVAAPKIPKRRSRAGCSSCKDKKKKCTEERPQCGRCAERGLTCTYEPVKPRQRRKRDPSVSQALDGASTSVSHSSPYSPSRRLSELSRHSRSSSPEEFFSHDGGFQEAGVHAVDGGVLSPLGSNFDAVSLATYQSAEASLLSPLGSVTFDFSIDPDDESACQAEESLTDPLLSPTSGAVILPSRSLHPDLAMIAPCPVASPLREFHVPAFLEFSDRPNRRALVDHFCNVLSHLIVFREESGNPFQQLLLPLSTQSHPVMNAIYALASAHLEYRGVENGERSLHFHNQAIQGLARLIQNDAKKKRTEILAAIMLLVYYEVLVQKGRSNIVDGHLKGAMSIMSSNTEAPDPAAVFLERAFRFYDVIAALSFGTAPLSTAPAAGCLIPFPPIGAPESSSLSNVDTLLGMATTLWPIIHRLSNLRSLKSDLQAAIQANTATTKIAVLRTELQTTAEAIEGALGQWTPCLPPNFVSDSEDATKVIKRESQDGTDAVAETGRIHSILNNALAYRHSALVYLYRTVYGYSRSSPSVQTQAHIALTHCVATVAHAGPMGALLWPLFVAACEAVSQDDRELARRAFDAVEKRQGMVNIGRAREIVQEVWRRADIAEAGEEQRRGQGAYGQADETQGGDLWRQVSQEMGVNIVFG